ncbi:MAG: hypothetical protein IRD7MM_05320 [Candidatus Midichloria mitochondrii]|nr:ankyrin repeat domain-containing protein [Candidatus Midichloria mitochondrii]
MYIKSKSPIISSSDVNVMIRQMSYDCFAFAKKGDIENVSRILDLLGLNVACDEEGNTLLHIAAYNSNIELASFLVRVGFALQVKNKKKLTPREICILNSNSQMQLFFTREESSQLLFSSIIAGDRENFIKAILNGADIKRFVHTKPFLGAYLLHYMAFYDRVEMIEYVCSNFKMNINCQDYSLQETPLHTASQNNHPETVKALVRNNADTNKKDSMGWTPLHRAAINGSKKSLIALLESNVLVNTQDIMGDSPLHSALKNHNHTILPLLIKAEANLNLPNNLGDTPRHLARQMNVNLNNL